MYVGQTKNLEQRFDQHKQSKKFLGHDISMVSVRSVKRCENIKQLERDEINKYANLQNVQLYVEPKSVVPTAGKTRGDVSVRGAITKDKSRDKSVIVFDIITDGKRHKKKWTIGVKGRDEAACMLLAKTYQYDYCNK